VHVTGGRPIGQHHIPEGTGKWGLEWKRALARYYNHAFSISIHGASMAARGNYLALDPTYTNAYGQPLLQMTFDFPENDRKMSAFVTERAAEIARRVPDVETIRINGLAEHYDIVPYQTTHNTGGAVMGADPTKSVVNRFLQHWDAHNLFVVGASAYPQNAGYNPTGTLGALTYWTLDAIRDRYLQSPGPLA
jgi:gluconate 2-dehydrogenase alpha chain